LYFKRTATTELSKLLIVLDVMSFHMSDQNKTFRNQIIDVFVSEEMSSVASAVFEQNFRSKWSVWAALGAGCLVTQLNYIARRLQCTLAIIFFNCLNKPILT
jgi:hypothetical protein